MQFIDLSAQYLTLKDAIDQRIRAVLDHGQYIIGPEVGALESELASYVGAKHAISCANGTDALQLALMACDVGPGDAVLTTPFTFFATAEVVSLLGATPVFVDIDRDTYNIDTGSLSETAARFHADGALRLRAVIPVDLFGLPANYGVIEDVAKRYDMSVIEDAAQGFGGAIGNRRAGSFGDIATTSFFPAKPLGCYGDGGALFTDDDELAEIFKSLRVHGKGADKYDNVRIGMNSRLDTLQAAILLEKLRIFPDELERRQRVAARYAAGLDEVVRLPVVPRDYLSSWAQYTIGVDPSRRDGIVEALRARGIPTAIYYPKPLHLQGAYRELGEGPGSFPNAEAAAASVLSLPMHPYLTDAQVDRVVEAVLAAVRETACAS